MNAPRQKQDKLPPVSAADLKRADETLRRMLNTPPDPHVKKAKPAPIKWPKRAAK
jgi:hypothetical protein